MAQTSGGSHSSKSTAKQNASMARKTSCSCCPYGFHIDTDFVRYCDALISALYAADSTRSLNSIRRKFRLYDFNPTITSSKVNCSKLVSSAATQQASNSIFETQTMLKKLIENGEEFEEDDEDLLSCSTRGSVIDSPTPSWSIGTSSTFTKSVLAQIRNHLAQSLQRVKVLEAEVEKVPQLERQIERLTLERNKLENKIAESSNNKPRLVDVSVNTDPVRLTFQQHEAISIDGEVNHRSTKQVETRSVGTLTRLAPLVSYRNGQTQTEAEENVILEQAAQTEPLSLIDGHSQTEEWSSDKKSVSTSYDLMEDMPRPRRPCSLELTGSKSTLSSLNSSESHQVGGRGGGGGSNRSGSGSRESREPLLCERCSELLMLDSSHSEFSTSTPNKETMLLMQLPKSDSGISVITTPETEMPSRATIELQLPSPLDNFEPVAPLRRASRDTPLDFQSLQPSAEVKEALKIVNDCLHDDARSKTFLFSKAIGSVKRFWFKISGRKTSDARVVEHYLDVFEKYSTKLLAYIVNLMDTNGNTAMHYALSFNNFDIVSVLLDSKVVNVDQYNKAGYTSTMLMSLARIESELHRDVAERFFRQADVNKKAKQNGQTALMLAASHGQLVICSLLLQCGAQVNLQDNEGSTALMCASEHGHAGIVALLLAQPDCDPHLEDCEGSTALKIALVNAHNDVGVILYAGIRSQELGMARSSSSLGRLSNSISSPSSGGRVGTNPVTLSLSNSQITQRGSPPRARHASGTCSLSTPSSPSSK